MFYVALAGHKDSLHDSFIQFVQLWSVGNLLGNSVRLIGFISRWSVCICVEIGLKMQNDLASII